MILRVNEWRSAVSDRYRISLCATRCDSTNYGRAKTWRSLKLVGLGERMVALTSGIVDAAILNVDQVYQAEKLGYQVLIDLREIALELLDSEGIVVSKDFRKNQRNTVKRFF